MRGILCFSFFLLPMFAFSQFNSFVPENKAVIKPLSTACFRTKDGKPVNSKIYWEIISNRLESVIEDGKSVEYRDFSGRVFYKPSGLPASFLEIALVCRNDSLQRYIVVKSTESDSSGYFHLREKIIDSPYLLSVVRYE